MRRRGTLVRVELAVEDLRDQVLGRIQNVLVCVALLRPAMNPQCSMKS